MSTFVPPSPWAGRVDAEEGALGQRWHQIVQPLAAQTRGIALLGFACDAGVTRNQGRAGARDGPAAIRGQLANLPVHRTLALIDAGDVRCHGTADEAPAGDDGLEAAQQALSARVAGLLDQGLFPLVLGGGHEMAHGSYGGLARHLGTARRGADAPRIGIVNLDAHLDLRQADRATSGTPFRQIAEDCAARGWPFQYCCLGVSKWANTEALFARARALGARWRCDTDMAPHQRCETLQTLNDFVAGVDHLYLTICLDVLPAAVAPGVSAPAARGVGLELIESLVEAAAGSGKLRLADIAEMNPRHDEDNRTARVAARLAATLADGMAFHQMGAM